MNQFKYKKHHGYRNVTTSKDCSSTPEFPGSLEENMAIINEYRFSVPEAYFQNLSLDGKGIKALSTSDRNSTIPVLATGLSSNHFKEFLTNMKYNSQHLLKTFPSMEVVVFDLGLKQLEKDHILKLYSNFTIRKFPFEKFPDHVRRLKNYCWKPLAIQMVLQDYDFVYWTDTSVKTFSKTAELLFQRAVHFGVQGGTPVLARKFPKKDFQTTITGRTSSIMFKLLDEDPCMYRYPEISGGWNVIKRSDFTLKYIMRPWVSCALQYGCMEFPNSSKLLYCPIGKEFKVGSCHRYDQSVLGILLTRLFNENRDNVTFLHGDFGILAKF